MIDKGYYIKARKIQDSAIATAPPHVREIWDWLLKEANHADAKYSGHIVKRGQLFRTYKDIREGLHWKIGYRKMMYSENHTKKAMKILREYQMITTAKALGGVLITIVNYNYYQDPKNYESTSEGTNESTKVEPMRNQGVPYNNKKKKKEKKDTATKKVASPKKSKKKKVEPKPMTLDQFVAKMRESPQRHINIIGEYADEKKLSYTTSEQWRVFTNRNLRPARSLTPFTDEQISAAMTGIEKADYITKWGLETLLKFMEN